MIRRLEKWDKDFVWHPFTQMKEWREDPMVIIERGEGNTLIDAYGRRYIDGVSSLWCNVHGHCVPAIDRAIRGQLKRMAHSTFLGLSHEPAIRLSRKLLRLVPKGLSKAFYSDSGSAAVEAALKMAYQYWRHRGRFKKTKFLKLRNAYHGDTLGAVSVGGIELFHEIYRPLLFETFDAAAPYFYRDSFRGTEGGYARFCAKKVEAVLKKHHSEIAALVMEPVMQGAAGMLKHPRGYLFLLRRLTRKYGVLLIADEVATGFGRTGKMFACEHEEVTPDFLCLAKGITAGYLPLSATLTTDEVYRAFLGRYDEFKAFFHGHTYTANPLACAAAIANLELFEREKTLERLRPKIDLLSQELEEVKKLRHAGDVRQAGFMAGIELVKDRATKEPYPLREKKGHGTALRARAKGVLIRPLGNVVVLMPPLSIHPRELRTLCRVVRESIEEETE
ncbi:MAG: adenosylmethionine--8-amino-7-oxononanoate transaminase [Candidatus Omnitrophica bacterium]|nr:adenosylmethionine--8-amino-7-oxononanoate transaminase [Candidatus Omnitrophota bacterium]